MRASFGIGLCASAGAFALTGCFAIIDVDRFHSAPKSNMVSGTVLPVADAYLDMSFTLIGMTPHTTQLFEYRVVDAANHVQSRAVVNPLGAVDSVILAPQFVPNMASPQTMNGPFRLDFYADVNNSGGYDGKGPNGSAIYDDHSWRIAPLVDYPAGSISPIPGLVQVTFTHNTSFTDINNDVTGTRNPPTDSGLGATIHVVNAGSLMGVLVQALVIEPITKRTVGLFRLPKVTQASFDMTIPGIVEELTDYKVTIFADANGNGVYDNPATAGAGDLGWSLEGTSGTVDAGSFAAAMGDGGVSAQVTGLTVPFDPTASGPSNVDVGSPW